MSHLDNPFLICQHSLAKILENNISIVLPLADMSELNIMILVSLRNLSLAISLFQGQLNTYSALHGIYV